MKSVKLVEPHEDYKDEYIDMVSEWMTFDEESIPPILKIDYNDFEALVTYLKDLRSGKQLQKGWVPSSTFWLVSDCGKIIGISTIKHFLTEQLLEFGGHIGYGIRPSVRKKGYATEILRQSLKVSGAMGIHKVLLTCDKDNIGSIKVIEKNGGSLESGGRINDVDILRYWIEVSK